MLFHFVSRNFSPKRAENGLLENSGFLTIGLEEKEFSEEMRIENNFWTWYSNLALKDERF